MNKQQLFQAAQSGTQMYFDVWEKNPGIIAMRDVLLTTEPDTGGRMRGAQQAFPPIKALWLQMSSGVAGLAIPKPMKEVMNTLFDRISRDKEFAIRCYNTFPIIADRYGSGTQSKGRDKGKPRLNFVKMADDPICRGLLK